MKCLRIRVLCKNSLLCYTGVPDQPDAATAGGISPAVPKSGELLEGPPRLFRVYCAARLHTYPDKRMFSRVYI